MYMCKRNILVFMGLMLAMAAFGFGAGQVAAQPAPVYALPPNIVPNPAMGFNQNVNYTLPNFSQSPNIRKFVDSLPGLGVPGCTPGTGTAPNVTGGTCNQNNLGQYIPIAVPDTTTYPGSAFYNIAASNYSVQVNSDLPPTAFRGYLQVKGIGAGQTNDTAIGGVSQYLGPAIIARRYDPSKTAGAPSLGNLFGTGGNGWPVRMMFNNMLPLSNNATTCATPAVPPGYVCRWIPPSWVQAWDRWGRLRMARQLAIWGLAASMCNMFTENRITIPHLHGGHTPWISDGTPHQWITPAGDPIPGTAITGFPWGMKKGPSFENVPDMIGTAPSCVGGATVLHAFRQ